MEEISSNDDGFQSITKKTKKSTSKNHIFLIKSLPDHYDKSILEQEIYDRIGTCMITFEPSSARVEIVGRDGQSLHIKLQGITLQGRKTVVQRVIGKNHPPKQHLSGSWTKPPKEQLTIHQKRNQSCDGQREENDEPSNNNGDFHALCQQPLSSLLEAYGEQDTNWKNTTVDRLERKGKAPIHVEFTSFGYTHGVPKSTHSQSFLVWDCRHLPEVPSHLAWMDGMSGTVRHAMLRNDRKDQESDNDTVRTLAKDMAHSVSETVQESICDGHGYANPLQLKVYVGSESGRHRSVICAELAATSFRKLLRENKDNQFLIPVSVGTHHLHIDAKTNKNSAAKGNVRKEKDFDDE